MGFLIVNFKLKIIVSMLLLFLFKLMFYLQNRHVTYAGSRFKLVFLISLALMEYDFLWSFIIKISNFVLTLSHLQCELGNSLLIFVLICICGNSLNVFTFLFISNVFCTMYCILCFLHYVLYIVYCALCIVYCVLCTMYCILCIVHYVLCIATHVLYIFVVPDIQAQKHKHAFKKHIYSCFMIFNSMFVFCARISGITKAKLFPNYIVYIYCALCIVYCALCIVYYVLCTMYCVLCIATHVCT